MIKFKRGTLVYDPEKKILGTIVDYKDYFYEIEWCEQVDMNIWDIEWLGGNRYTYGEIRTIFYYKAARSLLNEQTKT